MRGGSFNRKLTPVALEVASIASAGYGIVRGAAGVYKCQKLLKIRSTEKIITDLETFLGKGSRAFRNKFGDLVIESNDGLRQFRMDFYHFKPHQNPHMHLIEFEKNAKRKKKLINERIFPRDVPKE